MLSQSDILIGYEQRCRSGITEMYECTQPLYHKQDVTQGQFLGEIKMVWIESFPTPGLIVLPRLKNTDRPNIYR